MSLSEIRPSAASSNPINSFNIYSLNVNPAGGGNIIPAIESDFVVNWTGPATESTSVFGTLSGPIVNLTFPITATGGNNTAAVMISQAGALPLALRPSSQLIMPIFVINAGAQAAGQITITTSGLLSVNPPGGTFTASSASTGFLGFGLSYHL